MEGHPPFFHYYIKRTPALPTPGPLARRAADGWLRRQPEPSYNIIQGRGPTDPPRPRPGTYATNPPPCLPDPYFATAGGGPMVRHQSAPRTGTWSPESAPSTSGRWPFFGPGARTRLSQSGTLLETPTTCSWTWTR